MIKQGCSPKGYKQPSAEALAEIHRETKYYAFDWVDLTKVMRVENRQKKMVPVFPRSLEERQAELATYLRGAELTDVIRPVESERITSEEELQAAYQRALAAGYEGLILKYPMSLYAFMKNKCWRKLKPHETIELQVVEVVEGEGKHRGRLGALRCVKADGTEVSVGVGWGDPERERIYRERAQIPGKIIEGEIATSAASKARHPVFKRWRDDRTSL
jgi:ATP-dependent DNA ligase